MDISMILKIVVVAAVLSAAAVMHFIFKAKDDNKVEEIAEDVIKKEMGLEIDLSPNSKEK